MDTHYGAVNSRVSLLTFDLQTLTYGLLTVKLYIFVLELEASYQVVSS